MGEFVASSQFCLDAEVIICLQLNTSVCCLIVLFAVGYS
jgi:hypothetical protein